MQCLCRVCPALEDHSPVDSRICSHWTLGFLTSLRFPTTLNHCFSQSKWPMLDKLGFSHFKNPLWVDHFNLPKSTQWHPWTPCHVAKGQDLWNSGDLWRPWNSMASHGMFSMFYPMMGKCEVWRWDNANISCLQLPNHPLRGLHTFASQGAASKLETEVIGVCSQLLPVTVSHAWRTMVLGSRSSMEV
jgi:hypothetical protein